MARFFVSDEIGDLSDLPVVGANTSIDGTANNGGDAFSIKTTGASGSSHFFNSLNISRPRFKFYFRVDTLTAPGSDVFYQMLVAVGTDNATVNAVVYLKQDVAGDFYLVLADSTGAFAIHALVAISANTFYHCELDLTVGAGTGAASLYLDGVQVGSSLTSQQFGSPNVKYWQALAHANTSGRNFWINHIEVDDSALIGESYVIARSPTSGTPAYDGWSKSSGSDASALLNDTPVDTADHVNSSTPGAAQTALIAAFSSTQTGHGSGVIDSNDTIHGVKTALVAKTTSTAAPGISLVGTPVSQAIANGSNVTLTFNVAPIEGDTVIVIGGHFKRAGTPYGPSTAGYTEVVDPTTAANNAAGGVWRKTMGPTPDTTVVCQGSGNVADACSYSAIVLRGVDAAVIDATTILAEGNSTNPDPGQITTVTNGALVIAAALNIVNDASVNTPTNYTNLINSSANDTNAASSALASRIIATAGNENPGVIGAWGSGNWRAFTIAIRPNSATEAGSAMKMRRRVGGTDTDTALTLTTSAAFYSSGILTGFSSSDLSSMELGVVHGDHSYEQNLYDEWVIVSYTPVAGGGGGTGTLSITEGADTVSSDGALALQGTFASTEGADTLSSSAALAIQATVSVTEGADTLSSAAGDRTATFDRTEGADTLSSTAALAIQGTVSVTEGADTASSAAALAIQATLARTEGADTLSSTATLALQGTLARTEGADTLSSTAALALQASLSATEGADTLASSSSLGGGLTGDLSQTEGADTLSSAAALALQGTLARTEGADTLASAGALALQGSLAQTEGADTLSSSAASAISGTFARTEGADTLASAASLSIQGTLARTEGADTLSSAGALRLQAILSKIEGSDILVSAGAFTAANTVAVTEGPDTLSSEAALEPIEHRLTITLFN